MSDQALGMAFNMAQDEEAAEMMALVPRWNAWRSSTGTPNISAMIVAGKGKAKSRIRSMRPRHWTASRRSLVSISMRPCICSISLGENAFTSPLSRVWSGGSRLSIFRFSDLNTLRNHR